MSLDRLFVFDPETRDALCIGRGFSDGWRTGIDYQDEWFDSHPEWLCEVRTTRFRLLLEHEVHTRAANITYAPLPDRDEKSYRRAVSANDVCTMETVSLRFGESYYTALDVDPMLLRNNRMSVSERENMTSRTLLKTICVAILEMQNPKEIVYRTPASWWQMLKRDHAPAWFKKRWPVVESIDKVIIKDVFPFPKVKLPDDLGVCIRIGRIEHAPAVFPA
jgi:hypothetical protein